MSRYVDCCVKWMILALSLALCFFGAFSIEKLCGGKTALSITRYDFWGMRKKGEISIPWAQIQGVVIDSQLSGRGGSTYALTIQLKTSSTTLVSRGMSMRWAVNMKHRILNDSCRSDFSSIGFHDIPAIIVGILLFAVFLGVQLRVVTIGLKGLCC